MFSSRVAITIETETTAPPTWRIKTPISCISEIEFNVTNVRLHAYAILLRIATFVNYIAGKWIPICFLKCFFYQPQLPNTDLAG